jgi:hypothetical protein
MDAVLEPYRCSGRDPVEQLDGIGDLVSGSPGQVRQSLVRNCIATLSDLHQLLYNWLKPSRLRDRADRRDLWGLGVS